MVPNEPVEIRKKLHYWFLGKFPSPISQWLRRLLLSVVLFCFSSFAFFFAVQFHSIFYVFGRLHFSWNVYRNEMYYFENCRKVCGGNSDEIKNISNRWKSLQNTLNILLLHRPYSYVINDDDMFFAFSKS